MNQTKEQLKLMSDPIQELLTHMGHIGSSDKIKPMESFSINFDYCPKDKMVDKNQTCFYCTAKNSRLWKIWNNDKLENYPNLLDDNTETMLNDPKWVRALSFYINKIGRNRFFRFFVAGEIPNKNALKKIFKIATNCPNTEFWLPTTKHDLIFNLCEEITKPENLKINLSWTELKKEIPDDFKTKAEKFNLKIAIATTDENLINCHADKTSSHNCEYCTKCIDDRSPDNTIIYYKLKISESKLKILEQ
jgi:hypothetical protein